jgi:hypothetical protein
MITSFHGSCTRIEAVQFNFIVIGEAARQIPDDVNAAAVFTRRNDGVDAMLELPHDASMGPPCSHAGMLRVRVALIA